VCVCVCVFVCAKSKGEKHIKGFGLCWSESRLDVMNGEDYVLRP
jgi:hypothetical protein